jgi:hypothetical protein
MKRNRDVTTPDIASPAEYACRVLTPIKLHFLVSRTPDEEAIEPYLNVRRIHERKIAHERALRRSIRNAEASNENAHAHIRTHTAMARRCNIYLPTSPSPSPPSPSLHHNKHQ